MILARPFVFMEVMMEWEYSHGNYKMNINGVLHLIVEWSGNGMRPKGQGHENTYTVTIVGCGTRNYKTTFKTAEEAKETALKRAVSLLQDTLSELKVDTNVLSK